MSFTITSNVMNSNNPTEKVVIKIDPYNYYDTTNKRPKSGIFNVSVSQIALAGGGSSTDVVSYTIQAPNYWAGTDSQVTGTATLSAGAATASSLGFSQNIAINYGQFGPCASFEPDGTVAVAVIEIDLPLPTTATALVATVTFTVSFTEISPYAALSTSNPVGLSVTPTSGTMTLNMNQNDNGVFGSALSATGAYSWVALQLSGVTYSLQDTQPNDFTPTFSVVLPGGVILVQHFLSKGGSLAWSGSSPPEGSYGYAYANNFTWIFAVNSVNSVNQIDVNGAMVSLNDGSFNYNLANVALVKSAPSDDKVVLTLNSLVSHHS